MLAFIPIALMGGIQVPSPFVHGYNNNSNPTVTAALGAPTYETTGQWYWDIQTAVLVIVAVPFVIIFSLMWLKERCKDSHKPILLDL